MHGGATPTAIVGTDDVGGLTAILVAVGLLLVAAPVAYIIALAM